jgi:hypothetical protein
MSEMDETEALQKLPVVCRRQTKKAIETRVLKLQGMIKKKSASKKTISKRQEDAVIHMKREIFLLNIKKRLLNDTLREHIKKNIPTLCLGLLFYELNLITPGEKIPPDERQKVNKEVC